MSNETYEYTLTLAKSHLLMILCAVIAVGAGALALTNHNGMSIAGFHVSVLGATLIYGAVGALGAAVAWEEFRAFMRPSEQRVQIQLDQEAIVAPASNDDDRLVRLTYKGISDIKARDRDGTRFLEIKHIDGNIRICGSALESKDAFNRLWRSLESRVGLHRGYRY